MCTETKPFAGTTQVKSCKNVFTDTFLLTLNIEKSNIQAPKGGQFYMLRSNPSSVFLCRPISVYRSYAKKAGIHLEFLFFTVGNGTRELSTLKKGDLIDLFGPLGNGYTAPQNLPNNPKKVALVGGSLGVAPLAGFSAELKPKTYDFFAAFQSGSYGLDFVKPKNLHICTEDGSCGKKGILPIIFNEQTAAQYDVVYSCGSPNMLKYVKKICEEAGTPCYLSAEAHMACGVGACLGCTVKTVDGNKRACKDGPVFAGTQLL